MSDGNQDSVVVAMIPSKIPILVGQRWAVMMGTAILSKDHGLMRR
jgi:hypothetical protein